MLRTETVPLLNFQLCEWSVQRERAILFLDNICFFFYSDAYFKFWLIQFTVKLCLCLYLVMILISEVEVDGSVFLHGLAYGTLLMTFNVRTKISSEESTDTGKSTIALNQINSTFISFSARDHYALNGSKIS